MLSTSFAWSHHRHINMEKNENLHFSGSKSLEETISEKLILVGSNVRKLYKTILRLHRGLPEEMRLLGDQYVRDEFRRHKEISKEHVAPFMLEWTEYCQTLAKQLGLRGPKTTTGELGKHLPVEKLDEFESDQIYQLYELRKSIAPLDENKIKKG